MQTIMQCSALRSIATFAILAIMWPGAESATVAGSDDKDKKPSLSLRVTPGLATAPARLRARAVARGGADDNADFYCPILEWDWGDGTKSESAKDCNPYEPGKSVIARRFSATHTYHEGGRYRVVLRLKQKDRIVAMAVRNIQVLRTHQ
jgi:hypothetical protein